MNINKSNSIFSSEGIKLIEEKYNARYLLDTALKEKNGNWSLIQGAIFYQETAHEESGSHYFAMFRDPVLNKVHITNGQWVEEQQFVFVETSEGLVHSPTRHSFISTEHGFIDGGRDYLRTDVPDKYLKHYVIVNGELVNVDRNSV